MREFVELAARELGLTLAWEGKGPATMGLVVRDRVHRLPQGRVVVRIDPRYFRPTEVETLLGDASLAHARLGWKPRIGFEQLVTEMVASDYDRARRFSLIKQHGFQTMDHHE